MRKDEPGYERWYARHRIVENDRVRRLKAMENPVIVVDDEQRGELPETFSLAEMYWHPAECTCGSCISPMKREIKLIHAATRPLPRSIRASNPVPELPDPLLRHLQDVAAKVLSQEDSSPSSQTELESQP